MRRDSSFLKLVRQTLDELISECSLANKDYAGESNNARHYIIRDKEKVRDYVYFAKRLEGKL